MDTHNDLKKHMDLFPFYGWAPGNYTGKCAVTGEEFMGDKRCLVSLAGAITRAKEDIRDLLKARHEIADLKVQHRKDIEALQATILSQAREIERLKDQP